MKKIRGNPAGWTLAELEVLRSVHLGPHIDLSQLDLLIRIRREAAALEDKTHDPSAMVKGPAEIDQAVQKLRRMNKNVAPAGAWS